MVTQKRTLRVIINELVERANTDTKRLRVLEQKTDILTSRINNIEQAILENRKEINSSLSDINKRITETSDRVLKMENIMKQMIDRLKKFATEKKINELERRIEIYNPIKSQFVTKEELEQMLKEKK